MDNKAFLNSPALSSLILASNQLQTIETSVFYPIPNIEILDVSINKLSMPRDNCMKVKQDYANHSRSTLVNFACIGVAPL